MQRNEGNMKKIAFNIKYRQDIENGKYKVVTETGIPVNILRWDMKGRYPILGCTMVSCCDWVGENSWEEERPIAFDKEGCPIGYIPSSGMKLCLVSIEPDSPKKSNMEILQMCKEWFEDIAEKAELLTAGNVSHNGKVIRAYARQYAEYIDEQLKTNAPEPIHQTHE